MAIRDTPAADQRKGFTADIINISLSITLFGRTFLISILVWFSAWFAALFCGLLCCVSGTCYDYQQTNWSYFAMCMAALDVVFSNSQVC